VNRPRPADATEAAGTETAGTETAGMAAVGIIMAAAGAEEIGQAQLLLAV
jgi:hypothetical protein